MVSLQVRLELCVTIRRFLKMDSSNNKEQKSLKLFKMKESSNYWITSNFRHVNENWFLKYKRSLKLKDHLSLVFNLA